MTAPRAAALTALALACATLLPPAPARATCDAIVRPESVYALERALRAPAACRPTHVETAYERIVLTWPAATATIWPAACAPESATPVGPWAFTRSGTLPPGCADHLTAALASAAIPPPIAPDPDAAATAPPRSDRAPLLISGALYTTHVLPTLWLLFFLVAAYLIATRLRRHGLRRPSPDTLLTLAITALALTLRAALPAWGPGDLMHSVHFAYLGPSAIRDINPYGSALDALALLAFRVLPTSDDTLAALALAASTASVPLLSALARRLGYPRLTAHASALLLAVTPLSIRFAPTIDRYSFLVCAALAAFTLLLAWLAERRPLDLIAATLAIVLGTQLRPDALWLPFAAAGLIAAHSVATRTRPPWLPLATAAAAITLALIEPAAALAHAATTGFWAATPSLSTSPTFLLDPRHNAFLSPRYTPLIWPLLAAIGVFRPPSGRVTLHLWVLVMALGASYLGGAHDIGFNIQSTRYQLPAQPFYLLLASAALTWPPRRLGLPLTVLAVALSIPVLMTATTDRTFQQEYRFLRQNLSKIPNDCAILTFDPVGTDLGLRPNHQLSISSGRTHRWYFDRADPAFAAEPCAALYINASCDADAPQDAENQRAHCVDMRREATSTIAEATLDNRAAIIREGYRTERVPVGLYWLRRPPPEPTE